MIVAPRAATLVLLVCAFIPADAFAQGGGPPARTARARLGPEGGSVTLANVRLIVPAGSSGGAGFAALGIGGIPPPPGFIEPTGQTGILVSVSPPPRAAVLLEIMPTGVDLGAVGGDVSRLALLDTTGSRRFGCRPRTGLLLCPVPGAGLYLLIAASEPALPLVEPETLQRADVGEQHRLVISLIAGLGVAAVLFVVFAICLGSPHYYVRWLANRWLKR